MSLKWHDSTAYSEIDAASGKLAAPREWKAPVGSYLTVFVSKQEIAGWWAFKVHPLFDYSPMALPAVADVDTAKDRAEQRVRDLLVEAAMALK